MLGEDRSLTEGRGGVTGGALVDDEKTLAERRSSVRSVGQRAQGVLGQSVQLTSCTE